MIKDFEHMTKDGRFIPLSKLSDNHLNNIIGFLEKRAEEGFELAMTYGFGDYDAMWEEEEFCQGQDALDHMGYHHYKNELKRRIGEKTETEAMDNKWGYER